MITDFATFCHSGSLESASNCPANVILIIMASYLLKSINFGKKKV